VYVLTPGEADTKVEEAEEVTSTLPLYGSHACTLFDLGATHSFISTTYLKLCSINNEPLRKNISVATPVGNTLMCKKIVFVVSLKKYSQAHESFAI